MRRDFVAVCYDPSCADAVGLVDALTHAALETEVWRPAPAVPGCAVWRRGIADLPVQILPQDGGLLVGDIFPMPNGRCFGAPPRWPTEARGLCRAGWGPYVALLRRPDLGWQAFREPSGQIDLLTWRLNHGVAVVASTLVDLPGGFPPRVSGLDWDRIATFLTVPVAATTESLFGGVVAVGPGEQVPAGGGPAETIWSPIDHAGPTDASPDELMRAFVGCLDFCTDALLSDHKRVVFELSGGLDSSSLAAAVAETGNLELVATWLNIVDPGPEADERPYAQAVADRYGFPLTVFERKPAALDPERFRDLGVQTWPAIAGVDAQRDLDAIRRLEATGATAILSGQGGDSIFFQSSSALLAGDLWREQGLLRTLVDPRVAALARRSRRSVWRVLSEAHAGVHGRASGVKNVNRLVTPAAHAFASGAEHAWVRAVADVDLPPGKRVHIRALATGLFNHAASRRREAADLLYPFLAQPMMELALGVPGKILTGGSFARPFQRRAYADRLPPLVRDRRTKGGVSAYVARTMAESLDVLRPYLIDGVLADAGVLDRRRLATVLDRDYLIHTAAGTDLAGAIAVEAWVRRWQTQMADAPGRWGR